LLIAYAFGLLVFLAAGPLVISFFVVVLAGFTVLGILVARDAPRWGKSGTAWGLTALLTGPLGTMVYAWAKSGGTKRA